MIVDHPENGAAQQNDHENQLVAVSVVLLQLGDTIRKPCLLDGLSRTRTHKLPYETDNDGFDHTPQQDDEAGENRMTVQHHYYFQALGISHKAHDTTTRTHHVTQIQQTFPPASCGRAMSDRGRHHPRYARANFPTAFCVRMREEACPLELAAPR